MDAVYISPARVRFAMSASVRRVAIVFAVLVAVIATVKGGAENEKTPPRRDSRIGEPIFVTGSLIPQRVRLQPIGTPTVSPLRVVGRREIDQTGRRTTGGILVDEPSLRVIGN